MKSSRLEPEMSSPVRSVIVGLLMVLWVSFYVLDQDILYTTFAKQSELATVRGEVISVEIREVNPRRSRDYFKCEVEVGYRVDEHYYQKDLLDFDGKQFYTKEEATTYCAGHIAVADAVTVYYFGTRPEVAALNREYFGQWREERVMFIMGLIGLALVVDGMRRYLQERKCRNSRHRQA